jgi:competence protein ComEA
LADLFQFLPLRSWADRAAAWRRSAWLRPALAVGGAALAVAVLVAVGLAFLHSSTPAPTLTLPRAQPGSAPVDGAAPAPSASGSTVPGSSAAPSSLPPVTVTVHVAGQVNGPGVYAVPAAARVTDAIVAAGGPSAEADVEQLNLAARVADGERIYVPRKGETLPAASPSGPTSASGGAKAGGTGAANGPVDLNTATAEQLDALPGVGPATSAAILTYRSSHGRFRSVTELLEVPGIGPAKLEALRPLVKV